MSFIEKIDLKVKKIGNNRRNVTHLAIERHLTTTLIYLRCINKKTGAIQWYETKNEYRIKDAKYYLNNGEYQVHNLFIDGIRKSKFSNWVAKSFREDLRSR
tara:strand:+ start:239 stop:541 length:303 start_codon:yes stop_codon:yes gene_type:complete